MRVIQSTFGTFHHFELARVLASLGHLESIYSTYPLRRLRREGVDPNLIKTFPFVHVAELVAHRYVPVPALIALLQRVNIITFDQWLARKLIPSDVYVAISGAGLKSGRRAQEFGARYVCDRGSSHIRYQDEIVTEEMRRWGLNRKAVKPFVVDREEAEYAQADAITVPSEFARQSFIQLGVPSQKVIKIPYGVRLDRFRPTGVPATDHFNVLFTGTVNFRKGVPYLLEAFRRLRHPAKRLRMIGPVHEQVRPWLSSQNLESVEILGRIPQDRLVEFMSTSHVMVLPSIEEGLALVQGQALACGCPLISSENTGGSDLFTHGVEGFIVPIRSAGAIAERLQQLADDPALRQSMSEAALKRVKSFGGWEDYGRKYVAFLQELTSRDSAPVAVR